MLKFNKGKKIVLAILGMLSVGLIWALFTSHEIRIPKELILKEVQKRIPFEHTKDLKLAKLNIKINDAKIDFGQNLIDIDLAGIATLLPLSKNETPFALKASTGVNFVKDGDAMKFYLSPKSVVVNQLDIKENSKLAEGLKMYSTEAVTMILSKVPVYTFHAKDMKQSLVLMAVQKINIEQNDIVVVVSAANILLSVLAFITAIGFTIVIFLNPELFIFGFLASLI